MAIFRTEIDAETAFACIRRADVQGMRLLRVFPRTPFSRTKRVASDYCIDISVESIADSPLGKPATPQDSGLGRVALEVR